MASLTQRMLGAAKLDAATYEEVEADITATPQALLVVVLASVAAGFGALRLLGISGLLVSALASLIGWYVWAFTAYFIGTRFLPGPKTQADMGQLLRTIGFSAAPGLIRVLGIVPRLYTLVFFVALLWSLATMIVAVRQALDYDSTWRAVAVCVIGAIFNLLVIYLLSWLLGVPLDGAP